MLADPHVYIQVDRCAFDCVAEPITDPGRVGISRNIVGNITRSCCLDNEIRPQAADASQPGAIPGVEQIHPIGDSAPVRNIVKSTLSN